MIILFVLFSAIIGYLGKCYFEDEIKKAIFSEQYSLVTALANNIDDKLLLIQMSLVAEAEQLPAEITVNPAKVQQYLDTRVALKPLFNNALFLFSKEGTIIAESPFIEGRRGKDISFRDYFQITMRTGKPHISAPYISTHNPDHPAIILTAPVRDSKGNIIALLAGSFDLFGSNFIGKLSETKVGKTGYVFLFSSDRTMIMHPDRTRIMKNDVKPGVNHLYDKAINGFEGSGETVNTRGLHLLSSFKRLNSTGWILGANYPAAEAYEPLREAQKIFAAVLTMGTLIAIALIWFLMRRYMAALETMTKYVASLPLQISKRTVLAITSSDEIETLADAFNKMLDDRTLLEDKLLTSEQRFRSFFEKNADAIIVINSQDYTINDANEALLKMLNCTVDEVIGKNPAELSPLLQPDGLTSREKAIQMIHLAKSKGVHRFEWMHQSSNRDPFPVDVALTVIDDGEPQSVLATWRDMSERKLLENKLRLAQQLETVGRLAGGIIHDCNNKLSIISGYAQLADEEIPENSDAKHYLSEVKCAAEVSSRMIGQLLAFSRKEATPPCLTHVGTVIESSSRSLTQLIGGRIEVVLTTNGEIWPVMIDPTHIDQIVMNMGANARDAMPEGGKFTIDVTNAVVEDDLPTNKTCQGGHYVRIEFGDTGTGMDNETVGKIFEPFFTTKAIEKGTGLGLATIHDIVTRNNGFINVSSVLDKGTLFSIYLPRHVEAEYPASVSGLSEADSEKTALE